MNYTKRLTHTLKLLLATVFAVSASLSANAKTITFKDESSGLYISKNTAGYCQVIAPTDGTTYFFENGELVIPSTVTYNGTEYPVTGIGNKAFYECTSLTSVSIPESIVGSLSEPFYGCYSLTRVDITNLEAWCKISFVDEYSNPTYYANHLYLNGSLITDLVIPESITTIKDFTFDRCSDIVYLDLGENITSIGFNSFAGCSALKGTYTNKFTPDEYKYVLEIPSSVTTIGWGAFWNCKSIENIWIGTGCTSIAKQAFGTNGNLKSVTCMAYPAPTLADQNVFDDEDYTNAYLYISGGDENTAYSDIYNSYVDESNYWRLFLKGASTIDDDGNDGGISVGVGEVTNDDIAVTTDGKAIEITGYKGEVNVYNVAGMRVYQGNDNRIELPNPGIYVVIVNGKSYKIAIK